MDLFKVKYFLEVREGLEHTSINEILLSVKILITLLWTVIYPISLGYLHVLSGPWEALLF